MGRIAFLQTKVHGMPNVAQTFIKGCPDHAAHVDCYESLADLQAARRDDIKLDAIVVSWDTLTAPHYVLESIWQHPKLCRIPVVIVHKKMDAHDNAFIAEYGHAGVVDFGVGGMTTAQSIRQQIIAYAQDKEPWIRLQNRRRYFFQLLHDQKFDDAIRYYEGHLEGNCTPLEKVFYRAVFHKAKKEFDQAVAYCAKGLKFSAKQKLEARFLHLIGNVSLKRQRLPQAIQFLEAAQRVSPKNLRRRFLLAQCHLEQGDREKALKYLVSIYKLCKEYPGIHSRLVELFYARAKAPEDMKYVPELLGFIPDRGLISLYKSLDESDHEEVKRKLLDQICREFSVRANRFIASGDFYGALKPYAHVEKLLAFDDMERQGSLAYCYARVHYHAEDFEKALEYLDKAESFSGLGDKTTNLRKLIEGKMLKHAS